MSWPRRSQRRRPRCSWTGSRHMIDVRVVEGLLLARDGLREHPGAIPLEGHVGALDQAMGGALREARGRVGDRAVVVLEHLQRRTRRGGIGCRGGLGSRAQALAPRQRLHEAAIVAALGAVPVAPLCPASIAVRQCRHSRLLAVRDGKYVEVDVVGCGVVRGG
eukprot:7389939-Prymnesium_polylepis.1